ncbi:MAG: phosphatase PAP2 family protein [SAR324 cluster bacterium]|nr:phosphatase PAP2 family protein [SAR324 cluster bacterium]
MNRKQLSSRSGLLLLLLTSVFVMLAIIPLDYSWTRFLYEHRWPEYMEFMRRTLFEGSGFGGSDPGIIFQLGALAAYLLAWKKTVAPSKLYKIRPYLGFIVTAGLCLLELVHSLKWIVGRARPHLVYKGLFPFTNWYESGPHFITDGIFFGSFPSGHTAAVFTLMTLSYVGFNIAGKKWRTAAIFMGILTLIYSIAMTIGRSMSAHHWLSDGLGIIMMGWVLMHVLYFHILKVPQQIYYYETHLKHPPLPLFWELRLAWFLFCVALGTIMMNWGLRSLFLQDWPWLFLLTLPGTVLIYVYYRKLTDLYRLFRNALVH